MRLTTDFYLQDAVTVAQELVGNLLVRRLKGEEMICRIVETEAYLGPEDKACHAYQNKRTSRTEVMFNQGGCAYVYLIYGIHNLFNVVTNQQNKPEAVLIRAVEPIKGEKIIRKNRNLNSNNRINLTNGPGKLCDALNIDRDLNGYNLVSGGDLYLKPAKSSFEDELIADTRINIDYAEEYKEKPWRFYLANNRFVSK